MFHYSIVERDGVQVISFEGKILDIENMGAFYSDIDRLHSRGKKKLLVNLKDVEYINSAGLNLLITLLTKSRDNYGEFYICNVPVLVMKLIATSKLENIFKIEDSIEEALQKFK